MEEKFKKLKIAACNIRKRILAMANYCGANAHVGGSLSMVEVLATLYLEIMNYNSDSMKNQMRDRFILSKGHSAMALYAVLAEAGILTDDMLKTFQQNGTDLVAHPVMNERLGIESSTGSLGQGISMAVGIAKAALLNNYPYKVYVMIGNGESNEGSVWEAAMLAAHWKLSNLTVIIDNNTLQSDGSSKDVLDMGNLLEKWKSFGFYGVEIDGHDTKSIYEAFLADNDDRPKAIIANTIKGKGISFMENNIEWHHNRVTDRLYNCALEELEDKK